MLTMRPKPVCSMSGTACARAQIRAGEIHAEHGVPQRMVGVGEFRARRLAGVIDQQCARARNAGARAAKAPCTDRRSVTSAGSGNARLAPPSSCERRAADLPGSRPRRDTRAPSAASALAIAAPMPRLAPVTTACDQRAAQIAVVHSDRAPPTCAARCRLRSSWLFPERYCCGHHCGR